MASDTTKNVIGDVPSQIIDQFLAALPDDELSADMVARLKELFANNPAPKEREIKAALLGDG